MFGLGRRRTFLDAEIEAWQLEEWRKLVPALGGADRLRQTPLILPTREFFPPTDSTGHAKAEHVFSCVRGLMGMSEWPCRLEAQPPNPGPHQVADFLVIEGPNWPHGTFSVRDGEVVITFAPELVSQPMQMVATFAHELSHYLLAGLEGAQEEETHELSTDLAVAVTGFGVFGANCAFEFHGHGGGWSAQRSGYLSPSSWAFALAMFGALRDAPDDEGDAALKPEIAAERRKARRYVRERPEVVEGVWA